MLSHFADLTQSNAHLDARTLSCKIGHLHYTVTGTNTKKSLVNLFHLFLNLFLSHLIITIVLFA